MKLFLRLLLLAAALFSGACTADLEQEARERLERQAEQYEQLILERETRWLKATADGMLKLLFLEAERSRSETERTSLALKIEDRMERFSDGIKAVSLQLKYKPDPDFIPFIAIWTAEGKEFQRIVQGDAVIPESVRAGLLYEESETMFTDGADDERRIKIGFYYLNDDLKRRLEDIRK